MSSRASECRRPDHRRHRGRGCPLEEGSRECPYCKEFVPIDAIKCKYCTADIDPVVADEDEAPQVATEKRVAE